MKKGAIAPFFFCIKINGSDAERLLVTRANFRGLIARRYEMKLGFRLSFLMVAVHVGLNQSDQSFRANVQITYANGMLHLLYWRTSEELRY